jgi:Carboxymuconolactone decarboxylase family
MLPKPVRFWLFETLSLKTMRYVQAIPRRKATGLVAQVYNMIEEDFFINGSLTSRSKVPALMAGIWTAGRESILVDDRLDRTTKEAMNAVLSQVNDCPYCGDMLIASFTPAASTRRPRISSTKTRRTSPTPPCASAWPGSSRSRPQVQKRTRRRHSRLMNCRKPSQP